jgi:Ca2+-binding RTX toxin-like protein
MDRLPSQARLSLKKPVRPKIQPEYDGESRTAGKGLRQLGLLVVTVGLWLLVLVAGDALAGAELGARDDDALRGSDLNDRLAGFGGEDGIWGLAGDGLSGGGGDDEIYGGPGRDVLLGGAGDDFLETKDGERDYVDCGPGQDAASVDMQDRVSRTCEMIYAA